MKPEIPAEGSPIDEVETHYVIRPARMSDLDTLWDIISKCSD
jgi:hypothetical protein